MAHELWTPSEQDQIVAVESYVHYATGAAVLSDRQDAEIIFPNSDISSVVFHAEVMMLDGLRGVISHCNPEELRHSRRKLEANFDAALPHMRETVRMAYESEADRLRRLNPRFDLIRPMPLYNRKNYTNICHPHLDRIATRQLLDTCLEDRLFESLLDGRTLDNHGVRQRRAS